MTDLDELAESARNRGLKLVRSRVRTPGKQGFGKVGLTDPSGKPMLGMDDGAPSATPDEAEDHLRTLGASDWSASLGEAKSSKRKPKASNPEPAPKPKPLPKPRVREAVPGDAAGLAELIATLGHQIDEPALRDNLAALKKQAQAPLVATLGEQVVGLCAINIRVALHRPRPIGRIAILVVAKDARGKGVGRMLLESADEAFRKAGCDGVEVTSNDRLGEAHAFYRHLGYERTSIRFFKPL